jgi:uncharacterized membrane protein YhhN
VTLLRLLMMLLLGIWLGGIVLFAVLAPTAFSVLPTRHLAGSIVGPMLNKLHWIGLISGIIFLISSLSYSRIATGDVHALSARNLLVCIMLVLTLISQFGITSRMAALRSSMGEIDNVPPSDPARLEFNALHAWSTRLEVGVLILGLAALYRTAAAFQ